MAQLFYLGHDRGLWKDQSSVEEHGGVGGAVSMEELLHHFVAGADGAADDHGPVDERGFRVAFEGLALVVLAFEVGGSGREEVVRIIDDFEGLGVVFSGDDIRQLACGAGRDLR